MLQTVILMPLVGLVAVTGLVWLAMLAQRGRHMSRTGLKPSDVPSRKLADDKFGDAQAANNALMNLFELPVLFYVLCCVLLITRMADPLFVGLSWAFVGCRAAQALVHVTYNNVMHRGLAYLAGAAVLWLAWLRFAWMLLTA